MVTRLPEVRRPLYMRTLHGLLWGAVQEQDQDRKPDRTHVIGSVLLNALSDNVVVNTRKWEFDNGRYLQREKPENEELVRCPAVPRNTFAS